MNSHATQEKKETFPTHPIPLRLYDTHYYGLEIMDPTRILLVTYHFPLNGIPYTQLHPVRCQVGSDQHIFRTTCAVKTLCLQSHRHIVWFTLSVNIPRSGLTNPSARTPYMFDRLRSRALALAFSLWIWGLWWLHDTV